MTGETHKYDIPVGLTFDDVLLVPDESDFLPDEADVSTIVARDLRLEVPVISAAMDRVTEAEMAITLAGLGGLGIIHKNNTIEEQVGQVVRVKRATMAMVANPKTIDAEDSIEAAEHLMRLHRISGLPVVDRENRVLGIFTRRDADAKEEGVHRLVMDLMTTRDQLVHAQAGITSGDARKLLQERRVEKLVILGLNDELVGLITKRDILRSEQFPNAARDSRQRLLVGAAIGIGPDRLERTAELVAAGVDVIVIDSSHGHTRNVGQAVEETRERYPDLAIIAGNVVTAKGTRYLIERGADAVKIGIGAGSICTTRVVTGAGRAQLTAIMECSAEAHTLGKRAIADGGIVQDGDVTKAIAGGADAVMLGSKLAGTTETPGKEILYKGRFYKEYRGMGSLQAMEEGSADRYNQGHVDKRKRVPEGVVGRVPARGPVKNVVDQTMGGLRSGMGLTGCRTLRDLQTNARFERITANGVRESHPHDIEITEEPPNYRVG